MAIPRAKGADVAAIHLRIALALTAAATLLATASSGSAAWRAAGTGTPPGRSLAVGPTTVVLTPAGGAPHEVDPTAPLSVGLGDVVTLRMPVTIRTTDETAVLTVRPALPKGDPALVAELQHAPTTLSVTPKDGGPELARAREDALSRVVPRAADGHTYLVEWSQTTRTTRDGAPLGAKNAWGNGAGSLQGATVQPRSVLVRLTTTPPPAATEAP